MIRQSGLKRGSLAAQSHEVDCRTCLFLLVLFLRGGVLKMENLDFVHEGPSRISQPAYQEKKGRGTTLTCYKTGILNRGEGESEIIGKKDRHFIDGEGTQEFANYVRDPFKIRGKINSQQQALGLGGVDQLEGRKAYFMDRRGLGD